jgi:hypothetical protein
MQGELAGMLARAGFTRVVSWYQPRVEAFEDGEAFAEDILGTEEAARQLDPEVLPAVRRRLAQLAEERLASGQPIALDILLATARKMPAAAPRPGARNQLIEEYGWEA